ncbi:MAG: hypothetical protein VXW65_08180, partial [Pseudomonadota bacterium]|nr:hypothetical protein [Pseudomonadota bacterium]
VARFDAEGDGLKSINFVSAYDLFGTMGQSSATFTGSLTVIHRDFHLQPMIFGVNQGEAFYKINTTTGGIEGNATNLQVAKFFHVNSTDYVMNYGVSHAGYTDEVPLGDQAYLYVSPTQTTWMKDLALYNPLVSQIVVAGSHDAGMWEIDPQALADTQLILDIIGFIPLIGWIVNLVGSAAIPTIMYNLAVTQKDQPQDLLRMGVRHFDFRPAKVMLLNNKVTHVHGPIPGGMFQTFLEQVNSFLLANPSEAVFVEVKASGIVESIATPLTLSEVEDFLNTYVSSQVGYTVYQGSDVSTMNQQRWNDLLTTGRVVVMFHPSSMSSYSDDKYTWSMTDPSAVEGAVMNALWQLDAQQFNSIQCQDTASGYFAAHWSDFVTHTSWINDVGLSGTGSLLADTKAVFDQRLYARLSSGEGQAGFNARLGFATMINDFVDIALVDLAASLTSTRTGYRVCHMGGGGGTAFAAMPVDQIYSLQFSSGSIVDAVIINGVRHGGNGGAVGTQVDLRGTTITAIHYAAGVYAGALVLAYISLQLSNGQIVSAGNISGNPTVTLEQGRDYTSVLSIGGSSGSALDQLAVLLQLPPIPAHPIGGDGGSPFAIVPTSQISSLQFAGGAIIDAVIINGTRHGGTGGTMSHTLDVTQHAISQLNYVVRQYQGYTVLGYIQVTLSNGDSLSAGEPPYAQETLIQLRQGHEFSQINGIGGQAGTYLDQLLLQMTYPS